MKEHAFEYMLTQLGSRVAQEINFDHQKLNDGIYFRFFNIYHNAQYDHTYIYQIFSDSDRVPLRTK